MIKLNFLKVVLYYGNNNSHNRIDCRYRYISDGIRFVVAKQVKE